MIFPSVFPTDIDTMPNVQPVVTPYPDFSSKIKDLLKLKNAAILAGVIVLVVILTKS